MWHIPESDPDYVAGMKELLVLYQQPLDPQHPLVCYDEWRRALIGETPLIMPTQAGRRNGSIMSISGTASLTCTCCSYIWWTNGIFSWRSNTPRKTLRISGKGWWMRFFQRLRWSGLSWTTWPPPDPLPCTRPSRRKKHGESSESWSFTTRPNTAVGSIWPSLNWVFWVEPWITTSLIFTALFRSPQNWQMNATAQIPEWIGNSVQMMLASNWRNSIHPFYLNDYLARLFYIGQRFW